MDGRICIHTNGGHGRKRAHDDSSNTDDDRERSQHLQSVHQSLSIRKRDGPLEGQTASMQGILSQQDCSHRLEETPWWLSRGDMVLGAVVRDQ